MRRHGDTVVEGFLPLQPSLSGRVQEASASCARPLVERIRTGLPMVEFQQLQDLFDIPEEDLGRFLGLSPATLHRRKKGGSLTASESERIVRFARLFGITMEVFETEAGAREWLKTPNPGTAHEAPLSYADTEFGAREVENLLGRIDHGVF